MTPVYNISDINTYVKELIRSDINLTNIRITGEISNFTVKGGHGYFKMKDRSSALNCIVFRDRLSSLKFTPKDGMKVLASGSLDVYVPYGTYSFIIQNMEEDGTGKLYEEFERLKKDLEARGWFAPERKRPLPAMPRVIGVVTSESGAVIRDIINVSTRRFPKIKIMLFPVAVQGVSASSEIAAQLERISRLGCCDVVIVGRGGGSIEDLWAFNELKTAEAILKCSVPVISAVGHETDFTIADFVADRRAATPSEAAELAVPVLSQVEDRLNECLRRLLRGPTVNLDLKKAQLETLAKNKCFTGQRERMDSMAQYLKNSEDNISAMMNALISSEKEKVKGLSGRLKALDPMGVLDRGYCVLKTGDGRTAGSVDDIEIGDEVEMIFADGSADAKVTGKRKGKEKKK